MQAVIINNEINVMEILGRKMSTYVEKAASKYAEIVTDIKPEGSLLILLSNMPLITTEILDRIITEHKENANALTAVGQVYIADAALFVEFWESMSKGASEKLSIDTLNSIINKFEEGWHKCAKYDSSEDIRLTLIDSKPRLAKAISILKQRINNALMEKGTTIIDPSNTYIGPDVIIGEGSIIYPNCYLEGSTIIGKDCVIGPGSSLKNTVVGNGVNISFSVLEDSEIGNSTDVGPYAYVRPHSKIGDNCKIGDFVEVKNTNIGNNTKASHLTYIGDADVGSGVNFGCGTVVVNYDGQNKHRTMIKDNAFIGCNTNLVAPVTVAEGAYTAAGSTITKNVPENALGIARSRQINKTGWRKK